MNSIWYFNYNPRKCPCFQCTKRQADCHGTCQEYKDFEQSKPKKPINTYVESGKGKDPFHRKGRILTYEKKNY